MTIVARMLTQEEDGIPGYAAHPEGKDPRPGVLMVHHAHGVTADYKIQPVKNGAHMMRLDVAVVAERAIGERGVDARGLPPLPDQARLGHAAETPPSSFTKRMMMRLPGYFGAEATSMAPSVSSR